MPNAVSAETESATAPILDYGLPVSTEFEVRGFIDLGLDATYFVDSVRHPSATPSPGYAITPVATNPTVTGNVATGPTRVIVAHPLSLQDGRWQPHDVTEIFQQATLSAVAAAGGVRNPAFEGIANEFTVRSDRFALDETHVTRVDAINPTTNLSLAKQVSQAKFGMVVAKDYNAVVISTSPAAYQAALKRTMYGALQQIMVAKKDTARPRLHIVEHYRVASFLGNYGAANTVGTFTLLPGESTTITLSTSVKAETTRDVTSNVLDSFNEQSSQEFERQLQDQRSLGINATDSSADTTVTNDATQMSGGVSMSGGVNLGIVSVGGSAHGDIAHQSSESDTKSVNQTRQQSVNDIQSALDHHVSQSSAARNRQVSTGTRDTATDTTETSNVEVRHIENINRSRVLNFVVRQLVQEYHTVTYLHEVSFLFENGFTDDLITAKLDSLNDLLARVIVPARHEAVLGQIMHALYNVRDGDDRLRQLVEPLPVDDFKAPPGLPAPAPTSQLPQFRRRPRKTFLDPQVGDTTAVGAALQIGGHDIVVDGVVLDVPARVLRTNSVITDAVLGGGEALDDYNVQLQAAAVRKEELANDTVAAGIDALSGVAAGAKADAWSGMFNPKPADVVA